MANTENITFYLDGEMVDSENIDLNLYKWIYSEEEQKVYISGN